MTYASRFPRFRHLIGLGAVLALLAPAAQADDPPARDPKATHAIQRFSGLAHDRQLLVLQALGVRVPEAYFNCVCRAAGYGSSSASQFYHPGTIGEYNERYSCNHPGPPCVVSGFGCTRHDMPKDPKIYEKCAAKAGLEGGNPLDNILEALADRANRVALTEDPVIKSPDPAPEAPPDCAKARMEAGMVRTDQDVLKSIPQDRIIYTLSQDSLKRLDSLQLSKDTHDRILETINAAFRKVHDMTHLIGDESDLRIDFGSFEAGATVNKEGVIHLSEVVMKVNVKDPKTFFRIGRGDYGEVNGEAALQFDVEDGEDGNAPKILGHRLSGAKIGFSLETDAGELKYGIEVTSGKNAMDYYDSEETRLWENKLMRGVEDIVANMDFYGGGSKGFDVHLGPNQKINIGPEVTWKLKERYSNWVFHEMNDSLDNLLENQKEWEDKRREYIAREAKRFGIDARCFTPGQTIGLVHKAYETQKATNPDLEAPFPGMRKK